MSNPRHKHSCLLPLLLAFFSLCGTSSWSQVKLATELSTSRFLKFEPVKLRIFVENNSGNDLTFDSAKSPRAHLTIAIKTKDDLTYKKRVINSEEGAFRLAAGQRREFDVVINAPGMFNLSKETSYNYYIQLGHPRFSTDFRTKPKKFDVRKGQVLWSERVGRPLTDPEDKIESRKMSVQWFQGEKIDHYALVIEDDKHVYAVIRIGERVSAETPVCRLDARSNLHILQRLSARVYAYKIYDYFGHMVQLKLIAMGNNEGPPTLIRDKELGVVRQIGGRKAVRGEDYDVSADGTVGEIR